MLPHLAFCVVVEDSNSGLCAYAASTFPAEPSPQPGSGFLKPLVCVCPSPTLLYTVHFTAANRGFLRRLVTLSSSPDFSDFLLFWQWALPEAIFHFFLLSPKSPVGWTSSNGA